MQRDSVAFAVDHDCAPAVLADLMNRLNDVAAMLLNGLHGLTQPTACVQIDERPALRGRIFRSWMVQTAAHRIAGVRQKAKKKPRTALTRNIAREHSRIKSDGPIKINDRDVHPNELMVHDRTPCASAAHAALAPPNDMRLITVCARQRREVDRDLLDNTV